MKKCERLFRHIPFAVFGVFFFFFSLSKVFVGLCFCSRRTKTKSKRIRCHKKEATYRSFVSGRVHTHTHTTEMRREKRCRKMGERCENISMVWSVQMIAIYYWMKCCLLLQVVMCGCFSLSHFKHTHTHPQYVIHYF